MSITSLLKEKMQSMWPDDISREMTPGGQLSRLCEKYSINALMLNPLVFEKALLKNERSYDTQISILPRKGIHPLKILLSLMTEGIQMACDFFMPVCGNILLTGGMGVNFTLIFSPSVYLKAASACLSTRGKIKQQGG